MRHALAEEVLEDLGDRGLAEEADAQRGERDARAGRPRGSATGRRAGAARAARAVHALLDLLLDAGSGATRTSANSAATKNPFSSTSTRTASRSRAVMGDPEGAPWRAATSGGVVVVHQWRRGNGTRAATASCVSLLGHADRLPRALGHRDAVRARARARRSPPSRTSATTRAAARDLPKVTRDVIGPGLPPGRDRPRGARADRAGQAIYELDEDRAAARCSPT